MLRTVIFDLDHTLIRCDSFAGLHRALVRRHWWRVVGTAVVAPILGPLWASAATRTTAASSLLWLATLGTSADELRRSMVAHAGELADKRDGLVNREGLRVLADHLRAGDRVTIVTGSAADLARPLCDGLGLEVVPVIGSTLCRRAGGWVAQRHCVGLRKVEALVDAGMPPPWSCVYTDSAWDLPLLERAERRCLVNPRPVDLERVRRRLGDATFETVRW